MKSDWWCIVFSCCVSTYVTPETTSAKLKCKVDHRGVILFSVVLPEGYSSWKALRPKLYYKNDLKRKWKVESDCKFAEKKKVYRCAMHELTNKDRETQERTSNYKFKLSVIENSTLTNVTRMYFADNANVSVAPWQLLPQITYCEDSIGVKYMAANATESEIVIEWIRFPLDVDWRDVFRTKITIKGAGIDQENHVDKTSDHCKEDFCNYKFQSLTSCSKYTICLKTANLLEEHYQTKCRYTQTYCDDDDHSVKWQDTLLCVFGAMILIICVLMLWALCNKRSRFDVMFSGNISPRANTVNQDDLLNHVPISDLHNPPATEHLYNYPYALVTAISTN